jgi:stearoyl-CoA desaturase (delta-9 desaturase)
MTSSNFLAPSALLMSETCLNEKSVKTTETIISKETVSKGNKNSLNISVAKEEYKTELVWRNIIAFIYLHIAAIYGVYLLLFVADIRTFICGISLGSLGAYGVTAGAHRLWAHKSYKAKLPLRIILMLCQTFAFQNHIYEWCRDHRVHHKFTDTDADPHNSKRGFFFAHMGWLCIRKHPDVKIKGKTIDMSDLEQDPVVMFQKKYYLLMVPLITFIMPTLIPMYFWGESLRNSWYIMVAFRYTWSLNVTWCINSFAHTVGMKPFDKNITPTDCALTALFTVGEGWHNYHHVFPWDYKTSELGDYAFNWTTAVLDFFAKIGWAYDMKTVSDEMIRKRIERTGDGSHKYSKMKTAHEKLFAYINDANNNSDEPLVWGWEDKDMDEAEKCDVKILHQEKKID